MRKLIVLSFMTLDGVVQAPGGPEEDTTGDFKYGGWVFTFFDEFVGKVMEEQMSHSSDLLLGRKTFEIFASYWPEHEKEWPGINQVTKYVASKTISSHGWNNTVFLNEDIADQVQKIKQQDGADIQVHGSGNLIQTLLTHDLVDELWLKIFPVTLGKGKRLFENGSIPARFSLIDFKVSPAGVFIANYKRDGEVKTGSFQ